jgi:hypothetical protein
MASTPWSGSVINVCGGRDSCRQRRQRDHEYHHSSLLLTPLWCRSCWVARWDRTLWPSRRARIQCTVCMIFLKMDNGHHQRRQNRCRRRLHHRRCRRTSSGKKTRRRRTIFTLLRDCEKTKKQHVCREQNSARNKNRLRAYYYFATHVSIKLLFSLFSPLYVDQGEAKGGSFFNLRAAIIALPVVVVVAILDQ